MIAFAVLNLLARLICKKRIFVCKLSDDLSSFVDTCGTGKRNRAGALVLWNGSIHFWIECRNDALWEGCIAKIGSKKSYNWNMLGDYLGCLFSTYAGKFI